MFGRVIDSSAGYRLASRSYGWNTFIYVVMALLLLNAGSALAGGSVVEDEDRAITAEEATAMVASSESATAGEGLFNQVCVYCHGANGSGGKARKMQCRQYDNQYLYNTISNGKRRGSMIMPSWKGSFNEKTRWELVSYIKTLENLDKCK